MAMTLPDWLRTALEYIGYDWPATNEDVLTQWAGEFTALGASALSSQGEVNAAIRHVHGQNEGTGIDAFMARMNDPDNNADALGSFKEACDIASTCCSVCSGIVVTMKLAVIAQLAILAVSLASGPGALVVRQGVKWAIDAAINVVVDRVLNGVG
ncbi:hypothetical protein GCM10027418_23830 [Mariniluteicoccus endophyticus]